MLWCFLKIGASLSLFVGIIETILMAFHGISFRHTTACLFLKIMLSNFEMPQKAQNARAAAAP